MPSDEDASLPRGEQIARVESHAARADDRIPVVERLLHPFFRREVARDRATGVLDAIGGGRPAIIFTFADDVEFVTAPRAVLHLPQLPGGWVQCSRLDVAMADREDLLAGAGAAHERVVPGD